MVCDQSPDFVVLAPCNVDDLGMVSLLADMDTNTCIISGITYGRGSYHRDGLHELMKGCSFITKMFSLSTLLQQPKHILVRHTMIFRIGWFCGGCFLGSLICPLSFIVGGLRGSVLMLSGL